MDVQKSEAAIGKGVSWTTKVRDNGGALATAYDASKADLAQAGCFTNAPCTYDANKDRELWVQSRALARGKPRNVVARLRLEQLAESVPQTAVVSGALQITNRGGHGGTPIIDANGSQVVVRCPNASSPTCAKFDADQIAPGAPQSDTASPNMMSAEQLQRFKQRAIIDGNYFTGCPGQNGQGYDLSGEVVWVEGCTSPPNMTNKIPTTSCPTAPSGLDKDCVNSREQPRAADLALRPGRHGGRLDVPRRALRRQQLGQHVPAASRRAARPRRPAPRTRARAPRTRSRPTAASASGARSWSTATRA